MRKLLIATLLLLVAGCGASERAERAKLQMELNAAEQAAQEQVQDVGVNSEPQPRNDSKEAHERKQVFDEPLKSDWPMLGRDITRNPVSHEKNPPVNWDVKSGKNIKWTAQLGSMTHGTPVVADGKVYIGTNNGAGYIERYPRRHDLGVLLCFRESDGKFLWQFSSEKLPQGHVFDWPLQGLGASPLVEEDRMWFVSNRWEVICLDTNGFHDDENDGPVVDEPAEGPREADVVWRFDMIKELGVFPHNQGMGPTRRCSPAASYRNRIYLVTGNGLNNSHIEIPKPDAPSLICMDKRAGKVLWTDNSPGPNILHGQFASPLVAEIGDRAQVIIPQGDGWVRSFDAMTGKLIWKFDVNRKDAKWDLGGSGTRCHVFGTPVLYHNRIYMAVGQEVEHGEGIGRLFCLDPTKTGDISSELAVDQNGQLIPHRRLQAVDRKKGEKAIPNPNSGVIWEFTSDGDDFEDEMHRTISTVAIKDGVLITTDIAGLVHCFDAENGRHHWVYDALAAVWSTPLIVDNHVYVADEDGEMAIFRLSSDPNVAMNDDREPLAEIDIGNSVHGSPIYANGTLYVATKRKLFAIANTTDEKPKAEPVEQKGKGARGQNDAASDPRRIVNSTYSPTPHDVVAKMLSLANLQESDVLFDLGSGDGRIVIRAGKEYGCKAVGYEFDPELVEESRQRARDGGVEKQVVFHQADLYTADMSNANVVTLFLLPIQNKKLIPQLNRLRPGSRIVAHHFEIPGVTPDKTIDMESDESGDSHRIFLYLTPLKVQ